MSLGSNSKRHRTEHTDDACCTIANLIILTSRELHKQFGNLMLHLHLTQDSRAVIRDGDFTIG
jgi:hypothetical protein